MLVNHFFVIEGEGVKTTKKEDWMPSTCYELFDELIEDLILLKINYQKIKDMLKDHENNFSPLGKPYANLITSTAHIATGIYKRIYNGIRLPIRLVINRYEATKLLPESPKFWHDFHVIEALCLSLKQDKQFPFNKSNENIGEK